jgi:hypothetical protein
MQPDQSPTLYDRLGGVYNIATVVDDLIDRMMTDARLNENPAVDEAHHWVSPAGFKFLVSRFHGRPAPDTGQVPGARPGGTGSRGDRGEHARGHRRHPAAADRSTQPVAASSLW